MNEKKISSRYAKAIYGLAKQNNLQDNILADFKFIVHTIHQSRDLKNLMTSPVVAGDKKLSILKEIFGEKISELTIRFFMLLTEKSREYLFVSIAREFELIYNEEHNRLPVTIYSSIELDKNSQVDIQNKLADWTKKSIMPDYKIDNNMLGGLKINISDWVFDASIQNQLEKLKKVLAG